MNSFAIYYFVNKINNLLTDFLRCSDTSEEQYFEDDMFTAPAWLGVGMGIVSLLLLSPAIFKEHNITADLNRRMTQAVKGKEFIPSENSSKWFAKKDYCFRLK